MGLYNLDDNVKRTFVTDKFLYITMAHVSSRQKHDEEIENKFNFYQLAKPYFKRQVVRVSSKDDYIQFMKMALEVHDIILKPLDACMGKGIEAVRIDNEKQASDVFESILRKGGNWIVEERIKQGNRQIVIYNKI